MAGSIICGMDGSESAKRAARVAREIGSKLGCRLVFVHVVEAAPDEKIEAFAERLHRLSEACVDVDCGASWLVDVGHPVDRLVAAAADEEASFIVVGSQGPRSSLLGSISAEVSRRAPCPVVVVPPRADEKRSGDVPHAKLAGGGARFGTRSALDRREGPRCHTTR
jgi:nucleotide-binding universal stress UspA family protein